MSENFQFSIAVERHLTNPPTPLGFAVLKNGQPIAWLTAEQVNWAVAQYEEMERKRAAAMRHIKALP